MLNNVVISNIAYLLISLQQFTFLKVGFPMKASSNWKPHTDLLKSKCTDKLMSVLILTVHVKKFLTNSNSVTK